jgi:DNA (cytosine-5)-methyltransferase 1
MGNRRKTMTKPKDPIGGFDATVCSVAEPLTFGSLFAGIGGIDLGFERAGLRCKWQVEIEPYSQKVLAKHWPEVRRHDDVRTWPQPDTEYVDIIAGGFPCQDISYAGKGAGLQGERSGLFFEVCRIVGDMGPRIVVLENVAALLTRGMDEVLGSLASIGYDAEWHCIPAASFGAPHVRDRVFILGYSNDDGQYGSKDRQGNRERKNCNQERANQFCQLAGSGRKGKGNVPESNDVANTHIKGLQERQGKDAGGARQVCWPKPSRSEWWITEPSVGRVANGVPKRVDRIRGLGNAVVPQVAEYIGRCIVAALENVA